MSDENHGASVPAPASSPEQTIPKVRLDEVLAQKRNLEQQVQFQQQILMQMQQGQRQAAPQAPSVDQEKLRRLKEENPEAYRAEVRFLKLQQESIQTKQAVAGLWDQHDKTNLLQRYKGAEKRAAEVEQNLEQLRAGGNYNVNREQVYLWMLGQDKLREEQASVQTPAYAPPASTTQDFEAPTSDPRFASTLTQGKASTSAANKSFAEIEREIEDVEF